MAMMMHVLRPVRASASRFLATPTGPNSTTDYQQLNQQPHVFVPIVSSGGFVAVQQSAAAGFAPLAGYVGDCWNNVANLPIIYPMHSALYADDQRQLVDSPEPSSCSRTGSTIWLQPMQPVLWPVVRNAYDGMLMSGSAMQIVDSSEAVADTCAITYDGSVVVSGEGPSQLSSAKSSDTLRNAANSASGVRRQRRSKRASAVAARKAVDAAMCPEEVQELRRAVKNTEEACRLQRDLSDLQPEPQPDAIDNTPRLKVRWADALDDEAAEGYGLSSCFESGAVEHGLSQKMPDAAFLAEVDSLGHLCAADADADHILLELADVDGVHFRSTMDWVLSSVWPLACTKRGCRIVQKAMEVGSSADQQQIMDQLDGHVQEALRSPHANHVLQKCIEIMPPDRVQCVLQDLRGEGAFAARHRFGCRILQRLIEHCPHWQTEELVSEILSDTSRLCRHQYGNFVIQHILQHGCAEHRHIIAEALCEDTIRLAKHRIASHVLSCAIVHCAAEDVEKLTKVVLQDAGQLADLSRRQYGSFVVREVTRAARLLQA